MISHDESRSTMSMQYGDYIRPIIYDVVNAILTLIVMRYVNAQVLSQVALLSLCTRRDCRVRPKPEPDRHIWTKKPKRHSN
jgi:hypothetical protein